MRAAIRRLPTVSMVAAMVALAACGGGGTRAPSAPVVVAPTPTPTPTATTLDVLPCINQTVPIDRVLSFIPQGVKRV